MDELNTCRVRGAYSTLPASIFLLENALVSKVDTYIVEATWDTLKGLRPADHVFSSLYA